VTSVTPSFYIGDIEVGSGSQCNEVAHGFYFDKNDVVQSCKNIANCEKDSCTQEGCVKCFDGYYLEDN